MPFGLGVPELLIILVILVLIFGASRLSEIGGALGKTVREFRTELQGDEKDKAQAAKAQDKAATEKKAATTATTASAPATAAPATPPATEQTTEEAAPPAEK
jgi:sec-independent protein translocase protein TatA